MSVTAHVGTNVQFHCAGTGSDVNLVWDVDGTPHYYQSIRDRGITAITIDTSSGTVHQSNLTVPATSVNNGTTVRCFLNPTVSSNKSTLNVLPG